MNDLNHKNIDSLKYLLQNFNREALSTMKSLTISNEKILEFPEAKVFSLFSNILNLSITYCTFACFPSKLIVSAMPTIQALNLESCNISSVKSLRPLGELLNLMELNLSKNPIIIDRLSTLKSLLYYKNSIYTTQGVEKNSKKTIKPSVLVLRKINPAKVPRPLPFPMLSILNNTVINEEEISIISPSAISQVMPKYSDSILDKVKQKNNFILKEKERYGSLKNFLVNRPIVTERNPRVDTLKGVYETKRRVFHSSSSEEDISESFDSTSSYSTIKTNAFHYEKLPNNKEKINELLKANKKIRENAMKAVIKKTYTYEEVSLFMYNKLVHETDQINAVCDVLSIVNGVKKNYGITEHEVYHRLQENSSKMTIDDMDNYQKIMLLDDDIKNAKLKNAYFE